MLYFSPITLFKKYEIGTDVYDTKSIKTLKKRLLTELELSSNETLEIDDFILNKNDILELTDNLTTEKIQYFQEIDNDPVLYNLLNNLPFPISGSFKNNPLYEDEFFLKFISPYFTQAFSERISAAFLGQHYQVIEALENLPKLYLPEYTENSYAKLNKVVRQFYYKILSLTERLNNQEKGNADEIENNYCNANIIYCINALPDHFNSQKDEFAAAYINMTVPIHNRGKDKFAGKLMVHYINYLDCSEFWRDDIRNRIYKHYEKILNGSDESDSKISASNIFWIIFVLFQFIRMCS